MSSTDAAFHTPTTDDDCGIYFVVIGDVDLWSRQRKRSECRHREPSLLIRNDSRESREPGVAVRTQSLFSVRLEHGNAN